MNIDDVFEEKVNFVTCAVWVPKGVAKENPEKVEVTKEDLERLINETKDEVQDLEEKETRNGEDCESEDGEEIECQDGEEKKSDDTKMEVEESIEDKPKEAKDSQTNTKPSRKNDDALDFESKYVMDNYEEEAEDEGEMEKLLQLGKMAIHADTNDDPLVTVKDNDDVDSEEEDHVILPTDNLVALGRVVGDAAILEVHVYNPEESSLYCHHDVFLPSIPLCMEWLNYDPTDEELKPGNLLAIGNTSPVIEVWDLDLINCLEPSYRLGRKGKKKKKIAAVGHKDAVLSLSWNKQAEHVLASGSVDETVILWDLQHGNVAMKLTSFNEKVQALMWHHTEPHSLLTGACDRMLRLFDCNDSDSFKSWELDGEIESVLWDKNSQPYNCLASTENGTVYGIDCRQDKPLWTLNAHSESCTGLQMSSECPGCLVTSSYDKNVRIWDIAQEKPKMIKSFDPKLGVIHCLSACPDKPFAFSIGGDNRGDNFTVWDIRNSKRVRTTFCNRIGLPADEDEDGSEDERQHRNEKKAMKERQVLEESSFMNERSQVVLLGETEVPTPSTSQPKKFGKKKGGRLDTKRRKR